MSKGLIIITQFLLLLLFFKGKSDQPIRNSNILCMPQLQHGPQELYGEENTELKKQVLIKLDKT